MKDSGLIPVFKGFINLEYNDSEGITHTDVGFCEEILCSVQNSETTFNKEDKFFDIRSSNDIPRIEGESEEKYGYIVDNLPIGSKFNGYQVNGNILSNYSELLRPNVDIECSANYTSTNILSTCEEEDGFTVDGCHENYCKIPEIDSENVYLYKFLNDKDELQALANRQKNDSDIPLLTVEQFKGNSAGVECSNWAITDPDKGFDVKCNSRPETPDYFELEGCIERDNIPGRDYRKGESWYHVLPLDCIGP